MNLGELKLQCLLLMFSDLDCSGSTDIDGICELLDNLYADDSYRYYMNALPGAINRAFSSLEQKGVLPSKVKTISLANGERVGKQTRLSLSTQIPDFYQALRISFVGDAQKSPIEFEFEDATHLLIDTVKGGAVNVLYFPKIERISLISSNRNELSLPDDLCALVPYYVKGDLYRMENTAEALASRELYEKMVVDASCVGVGTCAKSQCVYSLERM